MPGNGDGIVILLLIAKFHRTHPDMFGLGAT